MRFLPLLLRILAGLVLVVLLLAGAGLWALQSEWGHQRATKLVRQRLAAHSDLVLAPLQLEYSLLRDFPYLTASLHHLSLTDTSARRAVKVLRVGRADMRLALRPLWHGRFVVQRLTLHNAEFRQLTDSAGHDWGLRGRGPHRAQPQLPPDFDLDSLIIVNLRVSDRNELHNSGFGARVAHGRLAVRTRGGVARVRGRLVGRLNYLRSSRSLIFSHEDVVAQVRYGYNFSRREGTFRRTRATLSGDTVHISGTHRGAGPGEPRGARLNLHFRGYQPLLKVLRVALPNNLERFLEGTTSPSHARIAYTIRGLSGPTVRPRTVLRFELRNAQVQWPDPDRRIRRWDARGVFDNGPGHNARTTYLTFEQCRIYSTAGQLDAQLTVRDFTKPRVQGRVRGRTELQTLASVVVPDLWRARSGETALDLELDGWLPNFRPRQPGPGRRPLRLPVSVKGTVSLENAFFDIPNRQAQMRALNVRVRLNDSVWQLENLTGQLNGMHLQANATITNLLAYVSGQHPTTHISGTLSVDELRLPELRRLLAAPHHRAGSPRPATADPAQAADMLTILPDGLRLDGVRLRCARLVLAGDTLRELAATVHHDGHRIALRELRVRVWDGQLGGQASWSTDPSGPEPVQVGLTVQLPSLNYGRLLARISRPPRRPPGQGNTDPTLREILLATSGRIDVAIGELQLSAGSSLQQLRFHVDKTGPDFQIPDLTFRTSTGGRGRIRAQAALAGIHLARARATVDLHYETLDVQRFLQLLADLGSVPPPPDRAQARLPDTGRRPGRLPRGPRPGRPARPASPFLDGTITGQVNVTAERMHYGVLQGTDFTLRSTLEAGLARLETCSVQAFGGELVLRGVLRTDSGASHHPLRAHMQLRNVELPQLFALATPLGLDVLGPDNVRGRMQADATIRTDLDQTFLPRLASTRALVQTDILNLELLEVDALMQALRMLSPRRTGHLYFEPVQADFLLDKGQLLIPGLNLSSNLTDMQVTGEYGLDGRADLYVGLSPLQTLFGNNRKRIERIRSGEATERRSRGLIYLQLHRQPGSRYKVLLFKKQQQRQQQAEVQDKYQRLLRFFAD
ncbi:AsmA-like C-terminal region-containing protein [Hymenobacter actinosclerus]|uniref:AsmA-like C-terminal region n=1 Tax=Hymenobacter actinosclerus TaxID=82805 RepID=A0A1I0IRL3_9BACT|nr:AsmA-like C-terminal region-containing protein [Hymenobacter actinosclerus]SET99146.1 AsmA-like C-terminal region [Hymenobacter actinosclerus]